MSRTAVKALGMLRNEVVIAPATRQADVQQAVHQGTVAPGTHWQEEVSGTGNRRHARINDNNFGAVVARPPDVVGENRETLADVDAGEDKTFGQGNVAPRLPAAVNAKRHTIGRSGGHHTEAPVIVDMPGAQGQAGKFAHQIRLLVGERRPRQHRKSVVAILALDATDVLRDQVERGWPLCHLKAAVVAPERRQQAVRMAALQVALDPFGTEHAAVHRKLLPGLKTDHPIVFDFELDATLHAAEAAMGLDQTVRHLAFPAYGGLVEMRTILRYQLRQRLWHSRHGNSTRP